MSDKGTLELKIDSAVMYTIHKGRMPNDVHELREWLREYAEFGGKRAEALLQSYKEHMDVCTRPVLWPVSSKDKGA